MSSLLLLSSLFKPPVQIPWKSSFFFFQASWRNCTYYVQECYDHSSTSFLSTNIFRAGRSVCHQGFFLRGVYRSNGDTLGHIEWGKCCKPSHHPYHWGACYNEDVSGTFDRSGLSECRRDGYFITGFETTSGGALSSIKKFKCCRMVGGKWGWKINLFFYLFLSFTSIPVVISWERPETRLEDLIHNAIGVHFEIFFASIELTN